MGADGLGCTILIADVVGSMLLYKRNGDDTAMRQITDQIDRLIHLITNAGGEFVHSRGDNVLATFADPLSALSVVTEILRPGLVTMTQLHVGVHFGPVIRARSDVFGDAVNLAARFAAIAKPGEAIISQEFVDRLPFHAHSSLRYLDEMIFKGKSQLQRIFTLAATDQLVQTQIVRGDKVGAPNGAVHVTLFHDGKMTALNEAESVSVGRSPDCDIVINRQWVSRHHATIKLENGRANLAEHSSSGTYISMQRAHEVFTRREDVPLLGSGKFSPGLTLTSPDAQVIHFTIAY